MDARTLSTLSVLNDLRHAASEALDRKHKYPALLLLYSFIDVCSSLAEEPPGKRDGDRFQSFLSLYALSSWALFKSLDLWAARSSLLHAYSPHGRQTQKPNGAVPIYYFASPETEVEMREHLLSLGYSKFVLVDVQTIKHIAVSAFNALWSRIESDVAFKQIFLSNAEHLLKDVVQHRLEKELVLLEGLSRLSEETGEQSL